MLNMWPVISFFLIVCVDRNVDSLCGDKEFESAGGLCCDLCPAGNYMNKPCSGTGVNSVKTECLPCPSDKFMDVPNNSTDCKNCYTACDSGKVMLEDCSGTKNRACSCPNGKYWDDIIYRCKDCTKCQSGEREVRSCGMKNNSQCKECPQGTYLDTTTNSCEECSRCKRGQLVVAECSPAQNTVCTSVNPGPTELLQRTTAPSFVLTNSHSSQSSRNKGGDVLYVKAKVSSKLLWLFIAVIVVLVLLLIASLAYIYKLKRKKEKKVDLIDNIGPTGPPSTGIATEAGTETIKESGLKFSDISYKYTEEIVKFLNPRGDKNWKSLAGRMNYKPAFVANLDIEPTQATQKLLEDWMISRNATVYRLYSLLKELGRDDAAGVLLPLLVPKQEAEFV